MYDFHELSPAEFEELVRDLLQMELGVRFETFGPGADGGIDARHLSNDGYVVVQAKHYLRSGKSKLLSALRRENPKIAALNPTRYIVAASVSMTPAFKARIVEAMPQAPLSPSDIFGLEDLNNLLTQHYQLEAHYPKLWLKGSLLLDRLARTAVEQQAGVAGEAAVYSGLRPLPAAPTLIGRDHLVQALAGRMETPKGQTLLILGAAAIGKTSLALLASNSATARLAFGHRRWFVPLDRVGAVDPATVQIAISHAIEAPLAGEAWRETLAELSRATGLLILDNLETCWESQPEAIEELLLDLSQIPSLTLCATLRGAERPSRVTWDLALEVEPLPPDDAQALFETISGVSAASSPSIPHLLKQMGGVPLAIELLAERAQYTPVEQLIEAWNAAKTRLLRRAGRSPNRLSSLDLSLEIALASSRVSKPALRLFRMLGHLPAGLTDGAAAGLLGRAALEATADLRRTRLAIDQGPRLGLLPPVREFAARPKLSASSTRTLARHVLGQIEARGPDAGMGNTGEGIGLLLNEGGNLESIIRLLVRSGMVDLLTDKHIIRIGNLQRLAGVGSPDLLVEVSEAAVASGNLPIAAQALLRSGEVALHRSEYERAVSAFTAASPIFAEIGERISEATCIKCGADVLFDLDRLDEACRRYRQALRGYRARGSRLGEANCWSRLADIALKQDRPDLAEMAVARARERYEDVPDRLGLANCVLTEANVALYRGLTDQARASFGDAASHYAHLGDLEGLGRANLGLAAAAEQYQDTPSRRQHLVHARELFDRLRNPYWVGEVNFQLLQAGRSGDREEFAPLAYQAWASIGREDLLKRLAAEIGEPPIQG